MKRNHRLNAILIIGLTLGFGFTIAVVSAAPPITVTSTVPDEAEQGITNLTVIINGRGFDPVMNVKFCRSETNEACVDGGVDVKPGSVRFISSKKLEVTVDVGLEAIIGNFDIEAISLSSGRRGRGIEKFAVLKAGGGGKDVATYRVVITQDVMAQSVWEQGSGRKSISYGANFSADFFTSLGVIVFGGDDSFTAEQGALCFPVDLFPIRLFAGTIKPHKGGAVADFWFGANTFVGDLPVKYRLHLGGDFDSVEAWLPVSGGHTHLMMTDWELFTVHEPQEIDEISCLGVGTANVTIEVTGL